MATEGKPLPIVIKNEKTQNFELDEEALKSVLLRDDVKDKPVCVVAVAGAFRKGKSFLLNYFLRYCANRGNDNWLGGPSDPLDGFRWVNSSERETTGILIWREPFIIKLNNNEEVAVILMDTQGTFDPESSVKESTMVFALSLLVSSVLVYNLMDNIGEDDLMNLAAFTQYGMFAREESDETTAFQKILFLVRDWGSAHEHSYGLVGGDELLEKRLEIKPEQQPAHQDLRLNLGQCFSDISCYLMPHPGLKAHQGRKFDGRHSDLGDEFVTHLGILVPYLLAPENIEKKKIAEQIVKAEDLFNNFKIFFEAFDNKDLPEPIAVSEYMANMGCKVAVRASVQRYDLAMNEILRRGGLLSSDELAMVHSNVCQKTLERYRSHKMNKRISESYERKLKKKLESRFQQHERQRELQENKLQQELQQNKLQQELQQNKLQQELQQRKLQQQELQRELQQQEQQHKLQQQELQRELQQQEQQHKLQKQELQHDLQQQEQQHKLQQQELQRELQQNKLQESKLQHELQQQELQSKLQQHKLQENKLQHELQQRKLQQQEQQHKLQQQELQHELQQHKLQQKEQQHKLQQQKLQRELQQHKLQENKLQHELQQCKLQQQEQQHKLQQQELQHELQQRKLQQQEQQHELQQQEQQHELQQHELKRKFDESKRSTTISKIKAAAIGTAVVGAAGLVGGIVAAPYVADGVIPVGIMASVQETLMKLPALAELAKII